MNICLISSPFLTTPPRGYGGLERVVWDLGNGLIDNGHKVVIIGAEGSQTPKGGFTIEATPCVGTTEANWAEEERKMWTVFDPIISTMNFDIIHGHNWFGFEYASKTKDRELNVCHTHHGHLNMRWWGRNKPGFNLNLMGISDWMVKNYEVLGFSSHRVYNGVDVDMYPFNKNREGDRLLFVGRIAEYKQPHVAIKVAQNLGIPLDIVGGTFVENEVYLQDIIGIAAEDPSIELYLDAPHEKKVQLMQNAKALLFPSDMGEPFGLVSIEAMSTGCPVVALDDGAIGEVIDETSGVIVPKGSLEEQVTKMSEAVKSLDLSHMACRRRAELFSLEVMTNNYVHEYKQILKGNEW